MEVRREIDRKDCQKMSVVPTAPPPPSLRSEIPYTQSKNLMKSAATLLSKGKDKLVKESALQACQHLLRSFIYQAEECNMSWFFHNNDVEAFLQDGPTCGLVALKLAADILKSSLSKPSNEIEDLLKVAQEHGFTYHGEMFSACDMGVLAKKYYELTFEVVDNGLEEYMQLIEHLCRGYPVLVPYDEDRNHEPCLKRGHKAHWAVLSGFLVGLKDKTISLTDTCCADGSATTIHPFHLEKGQIPQTFGAEHLFLIARQGKSRHYAVWPWINLKNSNKNLVEFADVNNSDLPLGTTESEKTKFMLTEGVQAGLCAKVVFLSP